MRMDYVAGATELLPHETYRLHEIGVIGNDECRLEVAPEPVDEKPTREIDVRAFLLIFLN